MSFITLSHKLSADSCLSHYKRVLLAKEQSFGDLITSLRTQEPSEQYVPDSDVKVFGVPEWKESVLLDFQFSREGQLGTKFCTRTHIRTFH